VRVVEYAALMFLCGLYSACAGQDLIESTPKFADGQLAAVDYI
jgi:hypothetical protein